VKDETEDHAAAGRFHILLLTDGHEHEHERMGRNDSLTFVNDTQFPMRIQVGRPMLNNRGPGLCCAVVCHIPRHGLR